MGDRNLACLWLTFSAEMSKQGGKAPLGALSARGPLALVYIAGRTTSSELAVPPPMDSSRKTIGSDGL